MSNYKLQLALVLAASAVFGAPGTSMADDKARVQKLHDECMAFLKSRGNPCDDPWIHRGCMNKIDKKDIPAACFPSKKDIEIFKGMRELKR